MLCYFTLFNLSFFYSPPRFYNDENGILELINNNEDIIFSFDGFLITSYFYRILLIELTGLYINLLLINILINYLMIKEIFKYKNSVNIFTGLLLVVPAIFFSHLSKEIPVFLFVYCSVFTLKNFKYLKLLPLIMIVILIRNYWILIIINTLILQLFNKKNFNEIIILISCNSFFIILYNLFLNKNTSSLRDFLTDHSISDSVILNINYLNPGIINDLVNYYYSTLILVIPFLIVNSIKLQYFVLTLVQILIIKNILKIRKKILNKIDAFCFNLFISALFTLVIFEPDLGSFSRHEFILFPYFAYILNKYTNNQ